MSNMSYCKFRNTLDDLRDCLDYIGDPVTCDDEEERARKRLIKLCKDIADEYADD